MVFQALSHAFAMTINRPVLLNSATIVKNHRSLRDAIYAFDAIAIGRMGEPVAPRNLSGRQTNVNS